MSHLDDMGPPDSGGPLHDMWEELEPEPGQVARMQVGLVAQMDRVSRSFFREWVDLLRLRPILTPALIAVCSLWLVLANPALAAVLSSLAGAG